MANGSSWDRLDTFISLISSSYTPGEADRLSHISGPEVYRSLLKGQMNCSRLQFPASNSYFKSISPKDDYCLYIYMLMCDSYNHALQGDFYSMNVNLLELQSLSAVSDEIGFMARLCLAHLHAAMMLPVQAMEYLESAQELLAFSRHELPTKLKVYVLHIYGKILSCDYPNRQYALQSCSIATTLYPESHYPFFAATIYITKAVLFSMAGAAVTAKQALLKACALLKPDGFILPFGEFFTLFDQDLMTALDGYWPENAAQLRMFWSRHMPHWIDARNHLTGERLTSRLTKREHDVAIRAAIGLTNKEIAAQLAISENTVKAFLRTIFNKLDIDRREQLSYYIYKPSR